MITLEEINVESPQYGFVESLLHSAFPEDERRPDAEQRANTLHEPAFHTLLIKIDEEPVGLLTYWDFGSFVYSEHFAVDPGKRNGGIGAKIFSQFLGQTGKPMVLEVEPSGSNPMAERRIRFYKRLGLRLWKTPYLQPPYRKPGEPLPLCIMATAELDEHKDFKHIKEQIHRRVYNSEPL